MNLPHTHTEVPVTSMVDVSIVLVGGMAEPDNFESTHYIFLVTFASNQSRLSFWPDISGPLKTFSVFGAFLLT